MPIPFATIRLDHQVHRYLGQAPKPVSDCLIAAFRDIRDRRLGLKYLPGTNAPFYADACNHLITASIHAGSNTVVILDVMPISTPTGSP
jgi:hypothetical protein